MWGERRWGALPSRSTQVLQARVPALAGALGSFSGSEASFPKILEPASSWHFLSYFLVLFFSAALQEFDV